MTTSQARPVTHSVDVDHALATLSHRQMVALAGMFERWALTEERIDPDSRTRMIEWASDYDAIAEFAGAHWEATDGGPRSMLQFLADKEISWTRDQVRSDRWW